MNDTIKIQIHFHYQHIPSRITRVAHTKQDPLICHVHSLRNKARIILFAPYKFIVALAGLLFDGHSVKNILEEDSFQNSESANRFCS